MSSLINIIIVCYNDFLNLRITIESIRKYKKKYHRLYIIDGCSSDNTDSYIKSNLDIINGYISEKDRGIYHAMNKVINIPQINEWDFIYWLNAGDELHDWDDNILTCLDDVDCCFAGVLSKKTHEARTGRFIYPRIITPYDVKNFFPKSIYMHQGFIIRKNVFEQYLYNENIGLQAENLLMSKCILQQKFICTHYVLATYYTNGISNTKHLNVYSSFLQVLNSLEMPILLHIVYHPAFHIKYLLKILLSFIK